ncbi:hypothetical protein CSC67_14240 [Pusillimonas caeni]|uniref:hypothetical protein n=1 Tax=Pusillimonas caeni TaxID=1348472 RepID=UPI000E59EC8D|nr:hypothetical protein [Pusillimonas caeni]TFL13055.1 hypothetical protein CSC67_14240 [Pusillimonas caeni]
METASWTQLLLSSLLPEKSLVFAQVPCLRIALCTFAGHDSDGMLFAVASPTFFGLSNRRML